MDSAKPFGLSGDEREVLRESVRTFAELLRRIDAQPEDAVIQVKQIVRDASAGAPSAERVAEHGLTADVVARAIEGYFAGD